MQLKPQLNAISGLSDWRRLKSDMSMFGALVYTGKSWVAYTQISAASWEAVSPDLVERTYRTNQQFTC